MTQRLAARGDRASIGGYVGDSLYPSIFHAAFAPSWIDALLLREGLMPPRGAAVDNRNPFTMIDIGCGDGLGLIAHAAAHPDSRFVGIDAMAGHIERGRAVAAELGLDNVELHCATFDTALTLPPVDADYASVQGVMSWVGPNARQDMLALVARNLKEGGVAAIGYNCMPGWANLLSFQKLLFDLSKTQPGGPADRYEAAYEQLRALSASGMRSIGEPHFEWMDKLREHLPREYFPHEYLNVFWEPLWSSDVIGQAEEHGLSFLRSAMPNRLREDFVLKKTQREALETIETPAAREAAADLYTNSQFRIDLYQKGVGAGIDEDEATDARLAGHWLLRKPAEEIEYEKKTPAGTIRFDNLAARAIVDRLERGPATFAEIAENDDELTYGDVLNAGDALITAAAILSVEAPDPEIGTARINGWTTGEGDVAAHINMAMTPFGPVPAKAEEISALLEQDDVRRRWGLATAD